MFRATRAHLDRRIDDARSDVHDLTEQLAETRAAIVVLAAALVLLSVVIAFTPDRR